MLLDEYPVNKGDALFDIILGWGVATSVSDASVDVKFGVRTLVYNSKGGTIMYQLRRTLYWSDPVVMIPPKNAQRAALIRGLCLDISRRVSSYDMEKN